MHRQIYRDKYDYILYILVINLLYDAMLSRKLVTDSYNRVKFHSLGDGSVLRSPRLFL